MTHSLSQVQLKKKYDQAAIRASLSLRQDYPDLVGVLVQGSVARGEPGPFSDIDLIGIAARRKKPSQYSYFDGDIYIPVGFRSLTEFEKEFKDPKQFFWARGSALKSQRILFDPKGTLQKITSRWKKIKPSRQIMQEALWDEYHHIIEYSGKLRNGWAKGDEFLTRYAARIIAQHAEYAIFALNDISIISENYLWRQLLSAKKKPRHLKTDYPLAIGLKGTKDAGKVYRSTVRLCRETLSLIKENFSTRATHPKFKELLSVPLEQHGL